MKKKYTIREYRNGIYEVRIPVWIWLVRPHLIKALEEISETHVITSTRYFDVPFVCYIYVITTMPKGA